ncbi:(2Fe-2S)-binding protein [Maricurvus nonylphenolicus]|uniref:(2Fe-2S)-binding protein n=1 Tax=Maricurvus nonylphenolicus TaxID=1008307 RepID=UPI0036F3E583
MISFVLNGEPVEADVQPETPLLWVIRDYFKLTGSKFGCGMGLCGVCSMQLDGVSTRTCILPVAAVEGRHVTTIEGLGSAGNLHPVQKAWVDNNVPQCGYCQSGQIISASSLLDRNPEPSDEQIDAAMSGNLCRCGTYPRIKRAIKQVAESKAAAQHYDASAEGGS